MKKFFNKVLHRRNSSATLSSPPPPPSPHPNYNPQDWLHRARTLDSLDTIRNLLTEIFSAPETWWSQFTSHCENILRPKYKHLERGGVPKDWKEERWNMYLLSRMQELRRYYGVELKRTFGNGREKVIVGTRRIRKT
ncbi:predicted protein [Sclerotinia sclerotiorum 1980 UF-70]|uniref:Uncharacterized protein n=2 Tax=Sclerotinia sclerotiorum (strain ATCC 18683 / 1980 / Ss-1) TaxID=665079 RepID=A7EC89_SCLS1|nr:predicted protein [Sclerotinia sclerotiorum 1980 UF-70]APA09053.1 hypothetical protein sscle_04g038230 [Sclerotinia sclerotiorum 1980 UF-70]EDO00068.1 predicted protein [Sclerotinia sclerotiorum 1980 UF-70]